MVPDFLFYEKGVVEMAKRYGNADGAVMSTGYQKTYPELKDYANPKSQNTSSNNPQVGYNGEQVYTRDYIKDWGIQHGVDISDNDIKYDGRDGSVYVKGQNIGQVTDVDEQGYSRMNKEMLDSTMNSKFSNLTTPDSQYGWDQKFKGQGAESIQNTNDYSTRYAEENLAGRMAARQHYQTDPMQANPDWWAEAERIYGGVANDEALGVAAEAGTGGNIDSTSLAGMERARSVRMMEAFNALNQLYGLQGEGLERNAAGTMDDYLKFAQGNSIPANDSMNWYRTVSDVENARKQTDATINAMNAEITGQTPADVMMRDSGLYIYDERGNAYLKDPTIDYTARANELEAQGKFGEAAKYRQAAEFKVLNYPQYEQYKNSVAPLERPMTQSNSQFYASLQNTLDQLREQVDIQKLMNEASTGQIQMQIDSSNATALLETGYAYSALGYATEGQALINKAMELMGGKPGGETNAQTEEKNRS